MLREPGGPSRIYIAQGYTDLRLGIDRLAKKILGQFNLDPFQKNVLFLFCGRKSDRIKGLLWEGDVFLLIYKRLEDGKFMWPRDEDEVRELTEEQLNWLMTGHTIERSIHMVGPKRLF